MEIKSSKMTYYFNCVFLLFSLLILSCNEYPHDVDESLKIAGENKDELIKVINHYSSDKKDSLKLKAAYYLIANIRYHQARYKPKEYNDLLKKAGLFRIKLNDSLTTYNTFHLASFVQKFLNPKLDSMNSTQKMYDHIINDIDWISSDYLIDNIDFAFKAYNRMSTKLTSNFQDFCRYILPYRVGAEPLEKNIRNKLYHEFEWVYDSLKVKPLDSIFKDIYQHKSMIIASNGKSSIKGEMTVNQVSELQYGQCNDLVNYFVSVYRSLGIPAGVDYLTHYGNLNKTTGHEWFFILKNNNYVPIEVGSKHYRVMTDKYLNASIPKIFKRHFDIKNKDALQPFATDVTSFYRNISNLGVKIKWNNSKSNQFYLAVYNRQLNWFPIEKALQIKNDSVFFKEIGTQIIYMPLAKDDNGSFFEINYPFYLNQTGKMIVLKPNDKKVSATINRKFYPYYMRDRSKLSWSKSINNLKIQGTNTKDSEFFIDLYSINNFSSTHRMHFDFNNSKKYSKYRIISEQDSTVHISEFQLFNKDESLLMWDSIALDYNKDGYKILIDNNPLTFIRKKNFEMTYFFKNPVKITGFDIQARNDDNHINKGEEYELFYWDKKWNSLGRKVATDTILYYKKVPVNAAFWLKNHTKGSEEHLFMLTKDGQQFWPGISENI